jgi:hypothetical protein
MDHHPFLSNFCWHDLCANCTGPWSKCEVCEAPCICHCHELALPSGAAEAKLAKELEATLE